MSKKPAAALSANLVAVKGTAAPASDMPGRAAAAPVLAAVPAALPRDAPEPQPSRQGRGRAGAASRSIFGSPIPSGVNSRSMRRDAGLKLNRLLRRGSRGLPPARMAIRQKAQKHEFYTSPRDGD